MILSLLRESNLSIESSVSKEVMPYIDYLKSHFLLDLYISENYFGNSAKNSDLSPFQF